MQILKPSVTVKGQRTDRECHECGDGNFVKRGHELVCENCFYTPTPGESVERPTPYEVHREQIERSREDGERPMLVGGYPEAYWGDGSYSFDPDAGSFRF